MRLAFILSAFFAISAQANSGRVLVTCDNFPFTDVTKLELVETDLAGQVFVRETNSVGVMNEIYVMYNMKDIMDGAEFSASNWNGYTRTLTRTSPGSYTITTKDECSAGYTFIGCVEN